MTVTSNGCGRVEEGLHELAGQMFRGDKGRVVVPLEACCRWSLRSDGAVLQLG